MLFCQNISENQYEQKCMEVVQSSTMNGQGYKQELENGCKVNPPGNALCQNKYFFLTTERLRFVS